MRLTKDTILFTTREMPKWNPMNVCSYHLQEAGATPVQELAFALATAIAVLDTVKASGAVEPGAFGEVVGRISFFVNAGLRFVTEMCKMRAFAELWDEITAERYGVNDPKQRLFRYGVQVNSLGPDRAAAGEQRHPHPARDAGGDAVEERARARRAAAGLERGARPAAAVGPAMVAAHAADPRLRDRPARIRRHLRRLAGDRRQGRELKREAKEELAHIEALGGAVAAVEQGYMKQQLVESNTRRVEAIERGEQTVVGVNRFVESEPSPLAGAADAILTVSPQAEAEQIERLKGWRAGRDQKAVAAALKELRAAAQEDRNIMPASIACAKAGVTTGEWGFALRESFGEYRAPTGVGRAPRNETAGLDDMRADVDRVSRKLGRRLKFVVGKPGLDGHSNGAEQIAVRARDAGMDVVYEGIRLTPAEIVEAAREQGAHVVGLSILSGSHVPLVQDVVARMRTAGLADVPVVVGGIIPPEDAQALQQAGVAAVYTPKDFELNRIMADVVRIVDDVDPA